MRVDVINGVMYIKSKTNKYFLILEWSKLWKVMLFYKRLSPFFGISILPHCLYVYVGKREWRYNRLRKDS